MTQAKKRGPVVICNPGSAFVTSSSRTCSILAPCRGKSSSKADSIDQAREVYARSQHTIDAYHQRFKDETFAEQTQLELLIDFENL